MRKLLLFFLLFPASGGLLLTGCHKDELLHHKLAGMWTIKSITATYYDDGVEDSTAVTPDAGILKLWDNHSDNDNIAEYEFFKPAPLSMYDLANASSSLDPQKATCWWRGGPGSADRLTLWTDSPLADDFVLYTVTKVKRRSMTLTYVKVDSNGKMSLKEVWECESWQM